ncbi:hypothetical protein, partial [Citrobacter freundii]|uniref:hypothetical protein n=1 Tax=Citrobacter freundii TaxID=546 RepID=UPI001C3C4B52
TVSVGMVLANRCHRQNMKTSIINGSEVSRLSVAIHHEICFGSKNPMIIFIVRQISDSVI